MSTYTYVPSQCFVFIKQSNSPGFFQFWIKHYDAINLKPPESNPISITSVLQSHTLSQTYGAILPTSLTYFLLQHQRLLTLETCCGHWYGRLWTPRNMSLQSCLPLFFKVQSRTCHCTPKDWKCQILHLHPLLWLTQFKGYVFRYPPDGIISNAIKKSRPESQNSSTTSDLTPREYPKLVSHKFKRTFTSLQIYAIQMWIRKKRQLFNDCRLNSQSSFMLPFIKIKL